MGLKIRVFADSFQARQRWVYSGKRPGALPDSMFWRCFFCCRHCYNGGFDTGAKNRPAQLIVQVIAALLVSRHRKQHRHPAEPLHKYLMKIFLSQEILLKLLF
ncbi:hypothetical protein [Desulfotignum balticum]|uniref:hypothetical protein n=1 Tax=Desulfotignum balticum TaxID=115781 RepID=UPI000462E7D9|nr:hypothetical protein [Desulfotignum balticum]